MGHIKIKKTADFDLTNDEQNAALKALKEASSSSSDSVLGRAPARGRDGRPAHRRSESAFGRLCCKSRPTPIAIWAGPAKGLYLIGDKNGRPVMARTLSDLISVAVMRAFRSDVSPTASVRPP